MECKTQDLVVNYLYRHMLKCIIDSVESLNLSDLRTCSSGHIQQPLVDKIESIPPDFSYSVINQIPQKSGDIKLITFTNGNTYTGTMRDDVMHGEGLFKWTDGCTYTGHFSDNQMTGLGRIDWTDQSWYEGGVADGVRHGPGTYMGARDGTSYVGQWRSGAKHGSGVIRYSWRRSHDGMWYKNVRDGYGTAEYGPHCVYQGEWKNDQQDGQGEMVWSNNDYYIGKWKNGKIDGRNGHYIWNTFYNTSMSLSLRNNYQGDWKAGRRHGQGHLEFGFTNGTYYDGNFNDNKKDGFGTIIKGNGESLSDENLFHNDHRNSLTLHRDDTKEFDTLENDNSRMSCAGGVNLNYHVMQLLNNTDQLHADQEPDLREEVITNGTTLSTRGSSDDAFMNEKVYLQMALDYYETSLKMVYHKYASNKEQLNFPTVLSRLYLWQLYIDIGMREKGIYLTDIDKMMQENPSSRSNNPHDPFEPVYYSQYLHSVLGVARKLYAKDSSSGIEPTTVLRCAFTKFMREDVLPNIDTSEGFCSNDLPLAAIYVLYRSVGEPHTVLDFLRSVHRPYSGLNVRPSTRPQPDFEVFEGKNIMAAGHEPIYEVEKPLYKWQSGNRQRDKNETKLFNIDNLSCRKILNILSNIEPGVSESGLVVNVNLYLTFIEFFEALFVCLKESISAEREELLRREQNEAVEAKVYFKKEKNTRVNMK